jgi:nitrite reductase (NO-forming)
MRVRLGVDRRVAILRIVFGIMWAIDASFKWRPAFINGGFKDQVSGAAEGQPGWLHPWFRFWTRLLSSHAHLFAYATALLESVIAAGLIIGFARRPGYIIAVMFSLAIWAIPEGFGGPYTAGAADIGTGIIYAVVFAALYGLETLSPGAWALDRWLERRLPWWALIAEPGGRQVASSK